MNATVARRRQAVHPLLPPALLGLALCLAGTARAQTAVDLPPNLIPLPASNFSLVPETTGASTLRFSTTSWNRGTGPLELVAGAVETGSGKQMVYQNLHLSDGTSVLHFAGSFTYHPAHNHMHFDDYALYTLQPVNASGGSSRTGVKTTFCIMDTTAINLSLPGAPSSAVFSSCGKDLQGMSIGWGDTYGAHLAGQSVDFTGNPDGIYQLKIEVDPKKLLIESNENDNVSCALLDIRKPSTVIVLDVSGQCSAVASITPRSMRTGTTSQVTITGYGFKAGMAVTFDGGQGPKPVAGNVLLASDTDTVDTITATVTVPYKKNIGRNPVWNVRVGSGGALSKGFTVTP